VQRLRGDRGASAVHNLVYVVIAVIGIGAILTYGRTVYRVFDTATACYGVAACPGAAHH
jgi:hypothetical protein